MGRTKLNRLLDRLVRPTLSFMGRVWSAYQVCGYTGLGVTVLLGIVLVTRSTLSYWVMTALILTSVATILATVFVTKIITGTDQLTYHHHEIAVLGTTSLLLWTLRQPLLPYLDVVMLGTGAFLVCGRLGCLMVGCCHGQPHPWGVCYHSDHAAAGLPSYLVGVRLFPIQAVESLYVFCIVLVGVSMVWTGQAAGSALAWYLVTYNAGRFCFEFVRGDPGRPYWLEYSEAQWTALAFTAGVAAVELAGRLPISLWQVVVPAALGATMLALNQISVRLGLGRRQLYHPTHIAEVARALDCTFHRYHSRSSQPGYAPDLDTITVEQTSLGIQLSAGRIAGEEHAVEHYTLSAVDHDLSARAAALLAKLVVGLRSRDKAGGVPHSELLVGGHGAYHLLLRRAHTETSAR
jgi:prolipoprotein diacylglyceryltransferase